MNSKKEEKLTHQPIQDKQHIYTKAGHWMPSLENWGWCIWVKDLLWWYMCTSTLPTHPVFTPTYICIYRYSLHLNVLHTHHINAYICTVQATPEISTCTIQCLQAHSSFSECHCWYEPLIHVHYVHSIYTVHTVYY